MRTDIHLMSAKPSCKDISLGESIRYLMKDDVTGWRGAKADSLQHHTNHWRA
jgi:hypothetical protein